jgi:hypothetical protein
LTQWFHFVPIWPPENSRLSALAGRRRGFGRLVCRAAEISTPGPQTFPNPRAQNPDPAADAAGRLWFEAPGDFRWELGRPAQTIALRDGADLYVIYPALRAPSIIAGRVCPAEWRDHVPFERGLSAQPQEFESQFRVLSVAQSNGLWHLALEPKSKFARQMMPQLKIGLATNNFRWLPPKWFSWMVPAMRNDFTNAVVESRAGQELVSLAPPADYKVTEPLVK